MKFLEQMNWIVILGILVAVETQIGNGSMSLAHMVPDAWVPGAKAWAANLGSIGALIMSAGAFGRPSGAPMMIPPIMKILLIGFALSFLLTGNAHAQSRPKLTGNIAADIAAATGRSAASTATTTLDSVAAALAKPFQDIATFIGDDADQAISLSTTIPALQDGHGQQCWMAMKSFGDIIKAHPVPITFHVINDYETLRLLGMATNNLCSNVHCTQVFADATAMAQAASPMPLAIPSLHDLCTKVPQIAAVAPVTIAPPAVPAAQ